jgi:hypothetical protein
MEKILKTTIPRQEGREPTGSKPRSSAAADSEPLRPSHPSWGRQASRRRCTRTVGDGLHHARLKAHRRGQTTRAPVIQPLLDHQAGNDRAGKRLGHLLESGGMVDRRAVSTLQQRLPTIVGDRHACVAGFKGVAIAAQRFRMHRQAPGENASGRPIARAARPETPAVARQPHCCMDQAMAGTTRPPMASPRLMMDKARARYFSNQWTMATDKGK